MIRVVEGNKYHCPFCQAVVVCVDSERRTFHEEPACEQWLRVSFTEILEQEGEVLIEVHKERPS